MELENLENAIAKLESIDSSSEYAYEKALLAFISIKQLPILIYTLPAGTFLFRTRTHNNEDFFHSVDEINLPPSQFIKDFARCNRPFQSVFYASENRPTSFMELVEYWAETKNFGETLDVTIGRWELLNPLDLILVTSPNPKNRISEFDKYHGTALDGFLEEQQGEAREAATRFFEYMFSKYRKPAKNDLLTYIITTAYSNLAILHGNGNVHGIYYPSVLFGQQGVNIAINQEFSRDNNLRLTHVVKNTFRIDENELGKHSFTETNRIMTENIDWENKVINWE
ncbi:RES domain-containing protein [Algoriphagus marincola]|uniref:RES domain-containing protein n=1 Tax=Algoriphagus marincola TaxID=264027 RepID=UPI0003F88B4F|nr:RES domain-containing protein [Algoriphagus marincola]